MRYHEHMRCRRIDAGKRAWWWQLHDGFVINQLLDKISGDAHSDPRIDPGIFRTEVIGRKGWTDPHFVLELSLNH